MRGEASSWDWPHHILWEDFSAMFGPFENEMLTDFGESDSQEAMRKALLAAEKAFGRSYPLLIGGRPETGHGEIHSLDPSDGRTVVGRVAKASKADVDRAVGKAWEAFGPWSATGAEARARIMMRAASIMRRRRLELDAWEVFEAGKPWPEADGDVAEAIDFLEYYAREAVRLGQGVPVHRIAGEDDQAFYQPLGAGAIIPPWNFPLAILTGMTSAAIVAGNTVLLKPASATPVIGAKFMEVMEEAGLPPGVIQFVPGDGGEIGDAIVTHPQIRFVSFTGSRDVGLRINRLAATHQVGQRWIKRVVAEMGGKDAILADETADTNALVEGIVASAFGFQGQKCSACSRAVLVDSIYDEVARRVAEKTQALVIGHPKDRKNDTGPVITAEAQKKIQGYIDAARADATMLAGEGSVPAEGYFIRPTIFGDVDRHSPLAQEEVFGPVLAMIRAKDFEEGLEIVNDTEYGLTGSFYSNRRDRIEHCRQHFAVGNLYINRKCTGAMVGAHPFGGFNLSGTDSKTGSPEYLLHFMQMKSVAEKL